MLKSSRRPVVAGVRQSIRPKRQCALRIENDCGPPFLHSSHRHEPRSDSLCLIRSTPALPAESFSNLKTDPTKAKNNRVSQLPIPAPYTVDVPKAPGRHRPHPAIIRRVRADTFRPVVDRRRSMTSTLGATLAWRCARSALKRIVFRRARHTHPGGEQSDKPGRPARVRIVASQERRSIAKTHSAPARRPLPTSSTRADNPRNPTPRTFGPLTSERVRRTARAPSGTAAQAFCNLFAYRCLGGGVFKANDARSFAAVRATAVRQNPPEIQCHRGETG
jgi:hypothetical protein